jgi:hypothetical protein
MSGSARAGTLSQEGYLRAVNPEGLQCALSRARPRYLCSSIDKDLHGSRLSGQVALGSPAANRATRSPTRKRRKVEKPAVTAGVAIRNVKLSQPRGFAQGVSALKTAICEGNLGDTGDTVSA